MMPLTLSLLLLLACQGTAPAKPDPKTAVADAVAKTRAQKSYETRFKAKLKVPEGAPLDYEGRCVWAAPSILYVHYTASGGEEKSIVRASPTEAWVYHTLLKAWPTADEAGMAGAGRGIQNPDEVLGVVARNTANAKFIAGGAVELAFTGADIENVMKEQAAKGAFDWKESSAKLEVSIDAEGRVSRFTCDATLKSTDPQVKGTVRYTAEVDLVGYNGATELTFVDEKGRPVPLPSEITTAITKVKEKK